jgi:uncharacterized DUF497 family protein
VYEDEAEEVAEQAVLTEAVGNEKLLAWGRTAEGRYLLVVYAVRQEQGYVITARDMTLNEKRRFRRRFGR